MLFVDIENFVCKECGSHEYQLVDAENKVVVCYDCGTPIDKTLIKITEESGK